MGKASLSLQLTESHYLHWNPRTFQSIFLTFLNQVSTAPAQSINATLFIWTHHVLNQQLLELKMV